METGISDLVTGLRVQTMLQVREPRKNHASFDPIKENDFSKVLYQKWVTVTLLN